MASTKTSIKITDLKADLRALATPAKAKSASWFFKTGPGQYGEGDQFIGLTVPEQRAVARRCRDLPLTDVLKLLQSPIHEERLTALFILVAQYQRGDEAQRQIIFDAYLANAKFVNNWDLVDSSAAEIVGRHIYDWEVAVRRPLLERLIASDNLWERRIAMIATLYFLKQGEYKATLGVAGLLINDQHDLIQKAVGWMLREMGKRCGREVLEEFLRQHYRTMHRTALRYAIEHFPAERRQAYLKGEV